MKCGNFILWEMVGRKKPTPRISKIVTYYNKVTLPDINVIEEGMVECDGDIKLHLDLDHGYGCSCCSSPSIEMRFVCDKCQTQHAEFPLDKEQLEIFVNELMNGKSAEDIRQDRIQDHKQQVAKANLAMDTWRKKGIKEAKKVLKSND